jgi:hypothetical protein
VSALSRGWRAVLARLGTLLAQRGLVGGQLPGVVLRDHPRRRGWSDFRAPPPLPPPPLPMVLLLSLLLLSLVAGQPLGPLDSRSAGRHSVTGANVVSRHSKCDSISNRAAPR